MIDSPLRPDVPRAQQPDQTLSIQENPMRAPTEPVPPAHDGQGRDLASYEQGKRVYSYKYSVNDECDEWRGPVTSVPYCGGACSGPRTPDLAI
jgi:hypothetical protein